MLDGADIRDCAEWIGALHDLGHGRLVVRTTPRHQALAQSAEHIAQQRRLQAELLRIAIFATSEQRCCENLDGVQRADAAEL